MISLRTVIRSVVWVAAAAVWLAAICDRAVAQELNGNCTVSILNRNVQVKPDGAWELPNVPAGFGQVRARATCVENGVTRSGESALFTIAADRMNAIPPIILGSTTAIPSALTITVPSTTLTAAGVTVQLTVTGVYDNGPTAPLTAASSGTTYGVSNPAIATVSPDGLVTAVASGTVVVQAINEGTASIITVSVVLSNADSDGDGIPDDAETRLGLDPQNPVDAQEDFDRDDLTNLQEFRLGTGLRNPDTDGDGLSDGAEVNQRRTNPLVVDTDGDGVPDGVEVQTDTDPLDPNSFNLARALASIAVTPSRITLVVNTIIGEATQQLEVTGRLIDGRTTINLTPRSRGTSYNSSDLAVANFSGVDGLVFAGGNGAATVTVANSGLSATAQVTVSSFAPTALSFVSIPGFANNVDVSGNVAYVAAGSAGLQVVDVTDRRAPRIVGSLDTPGNANDVRAVGNRVYIADGPAGLRIIDVSNPQAPALLGTFNTPGIANGVDVSGSVAVIADSSSFITVNVSNPASPTALSSLPMTDARDLTVDGNIAYLADFAGSLRVIDFSAPAAPVLLATTQQSLGGILTDVAKAREFVFGADVFFVNGVPVVNVSNVASPQVRARLDFPARDDNGTGIAVDNLFVYLTADQSIQENGVSGNSRLYIGQYVALEDSAGIPPAVRITSPAAGASVIEGTAIPVTVQATDDVQVTSVDILVNGAVVFTDSAAPYEFTVQVPTGVTSLTLGAAATDIGNNVGFAEAVRLNVIPDPLTTVTGRVVDNTNTPVAGATVSIFGLSTVTGADGSFTIPGVPTVRGSVVVQATFTQQDGTVLSGTSGPAQPVAGGTTGVGTITVVAASFEPNIGTLAARCDDCSVTRALPFTFSLYGRNYSQVHVNNNGTLTFNSADGDFSESVSEFLSRQPSISVFWDDLIASDNDGASGLYVNDQLPGRFVVTWWRELEYFQIPGPNTVQLTLFNDGRIQLSYQGVASLDAVVGLSPGGLTASSPRARAVDFSATTFLSTNAGEAVYEQFAVLAPRGNTDSQGSSDKPFDLDGNSILFTPNAGGGYDVSTIRGSAPGGGGPPALAASKRASAVSRSAATGLQVQGTVLDGNGQPRTRAEVELRSTYAPDFRAVTRTDAQGRYAFANVPAGGLVVVKATEGDVVVGQGAGRFDGTGATLTVDVRPPPPARPKNR